MNFWKKWLPFLFLNILISAATTLLVLFFWNRAHPSQSINIQPPSDTPPEQQALPTATLPAVDAQIIQVVNVFGAGNLENEYVVLEKVGEGSLMLTGWKISDEQGSTFVFPEMELLQGQMEIYTRSGINTVNRLFWNQSNAVWSPGEQVRVLDFLDQERASFTIP